MERPKALVASAIVGATVMSAAMAFAGVNGFTGGRGDNVGNLQPTVGQAIDVTAQPDPVSRPVTAAPADADEADDPAPPAGADQVEEPGEPRAVRPKATTPSPARGSGTATTTTQGGATVSPSEPYWGIERAEDAGKGGEHDRDGDDD